jgi:hypothetical protein
MVIRSDHSSRSPRLLEFELKSLYSVSGPKAVSKNDLRYKISIGMYL